MTQEARKMIRPPYRTILSEASPRQQERLAAILRPAPQARKENTMSENENKPAAQVYLHPVRAAIWRNEGRNGDVFYSTTFERRYRDKDEKWKGTNSFGA